jgi:hypothetical protein
MEKFLTSFLPHNVRAQRSRRRAILTPSGEEQRRGPEEVPKDGTASRGAEGQEFSPSQQILASPDLRLISTCDLRCRENCEGRAGRQAFWWADRDRNMRAFILYFAAVSEDAGALLQLWSPMCGVMGCTPRLALFYRSHSGEAPRCRQDTSLRRFRILSNVQPCLEMQKCSSLLIPLACGKSILRERMGPPAISQRLTGPWPTLGWAYVIT